MRLVNPWIVSPLNQRIDDGKLCEVVQREEAASRLPVDLMET